MNNPPRDARFDNLKGMLIFLVALVHSLSKFQGNSMMVSRDTRSVLVPFIMPIFIFISGYFSKKAYFTEKTSAKTVKTLLIPFFVAHTLIWFVQSRSVDSLFYPGWTLWYIPSLFLWKVLIAPVSKIRFAVIASVIIAILIGFSPADRLFSLSRTVTFFPFFLMGYKTAPETIERIRKIHKSVPILVFFALLSIVVLMVIHHLPVFYSFQMADPYSSTEGVSELQGMLLRASALLIGFISIPCLLALVPQKQNVVSKLGRNTMTVYLGHAFIILLFKGLLSRIFPDLLRSEIFIIFFSIALSVIICCILGNHWVVSLYNKVMDRIASFVLVKEKQKSDPAE